MKQLPLQTTHESIVKFDNNAFSGYDTKLKITVYSAWAEVSLHVEGRTDEDRKAIQLVPISVLRQIIEIHDSLPK